MRLHSASADTILHIWACLSLAHGHMLRRDRKKMQTSPSTILPRWVTRTTRMRTGGTNQGSLAPLKPKKSRLVTPAPSR